MNKDDYMLTAVQYHKLYCRAFARLEDISRQAEQAMRELEEMQLAMAEEPRSTPDRVLLSILNQTPEDP